MTADLVLDPKKYVSFPGEPGPESAMRVAGSPFSIFCSPKMSVPVMPTERFLKNGSRTSALTFANTTQKTISIKKNAFILLFMVRLYHDLFFLSPHNPECL